MQIRILLFAAVQRQTRFNPLDPDQCATNESSISYTVISTTEFAQDLPRGSVRMKILNFAFFILTDLPLTPVVKQPDAAIRHRSSAQSR